MLDEKKAYFLGVLQTDGKLTTYNTMKRNKIYKRTDIGLTVSVKSLPMLEKFQQILKEVYGRDLIIKDFIKSRSVLEVQTSVNRLLETFKKDGISKKGIPAWIAKTNSNFGAYLAGVIDGDGDVRIKGPYSQYVIRIVSGEINTEMIDLIKKFLTCSVTITKRSGISTFKDGRKTHGTWYESDICISKKNAQFLNKYVTPFVTIPYKKERIKKGVERKLTVAS